jgi:predicted RNA-binding protein with TRAM domain
MYHDKGFMQKPPIKEGDIVDVTIESVGEKGDGIGRVKGFVIFVPGVKQGETIQVRVTRVLRKYAFGEVAGEGAPPAEDGDEQPEGDGEEPEEDVGQDEPAPEGEDSEDFGEEKKE